MIILQYGHVERALENAKHIHLGKGDAHWEKSCVQKLHGCPSIRHLLTMRCLGSSHRSSGVGIVNVHYSPTFHNWTYNNRKSFLGTLVLLPSATSALVTQLVTYKPRSNITTKSANSIPSTQLLRISGVIYSPLTVIHFQNFRARLFIIIAAWDYLTRFTFK